MATAGAYSWNAGNRVSAATEIVQAPSVSTDLRGVSQLRYLVPRPPSACGKTSSILGVQVLDPGQPQSHPGGRLLTLVSKIQLYSYSFTARVFQWPSGDNDLLYGKIMVGIDARVNLPLEAPAIDVYTKTYLAIPTYRLPLSEEDAIVQEVHPNTASLPNHQSDLHRRQPIKPHFWLCAQSFSWSSRPTPN